MLEVKDITVSYGPIKILTHISLYLEEGEILGIIGPNGHGKTTLLRALSGLNPPIEGEIWFRGVRIDHLPMHEIVKRGIMLLPEGGGVVSTFTVMENLMLGAYVNKERFREKLREVYNIFPWMRERSEQVAWTLSGGERRMLAIARCLMSDSRLLLLDEPTWGIAPKVRYELIEIIRNIREAGISLIIADSDVRFISQLADRVLLLKNSKLREVDKSDLKESIVKLFL